MISNSNLEQMHTYISILRGINVSGYRMIKMDALRQLFSDLGFKNVHSYIQSGNMVFQSQESDPQILENKIAERIMEQFGFEVPVIVKELDELKQIVADNPFLKDKTKDIASLHVTFLSDKPGQEGIDSLKTGEYLTDEFYIFDKAIYLYCRNGYGKTKLTNGLLEKKLKVTATTRNWKTTNELISIAQKMIAT